MLLLRLPPTPVHKTTLLVLPTYPPKRTYFMDGPMVLIYIICKGIHGIFHMRYLPILMFLNFFSSVHLEGHLPHRILMSFPDHEKSEKLFSFLKSDSLLIFVRQL